MTWETIQNPYVPKGMVDEAAKQQEFQQSYQRLVHAAGIFGDNIVMNQINSKEKATYYEE